ncbi:MAG: hypothetical protein WC455_06280 [Dehalococcoidia bacterium]
MAKQEKQCKRIVAKFGTNLLTGGRYCRCSVQDKHTSCKFYFLN